MSRLRAETMPAVTVPPRLNGLPIAITHSPSRSLSLSPNFTALSGLVGLTLQQREIGLGVAADDLGLQRGAVVEDDGDLVGVGDDVIVGHDEPGGSMMKPEPSELTRRCGGASPVGAVAARFLKNSSKKSSNGEPGGSCGIVRRAGRPPAWSKY